MKNWTNRIWAAITAWWLIGRLPIWAEETRKAIASLVGCELKAVIATIIRWSKRDFSRRPLDHRTDEVWEVKLSSMPITAILISAMFLSVAIVIVHNTWSSWSIILTAPVILLMLVLGMKSLDIAILVISKMIREHTLGADSLTRDQIAVRLFVAIIAAGVLMISYGLIGWPSPAPGLVILAGAITVFYLLYYTVHLLRSTCAVRR